MERNEQVVVVSDAGPIIHLDELGALDLLRGFYSVLIPSVVWEEILRHRPGLELSAIPASVIADAPDTGSSQLISIADAFALDIGERTALRLMEIQNNAIFLTDDAAARLAAESLRIRVHGTLGILIRSVRLGYRSRRDTITLLQSLPLRSTLHISRELLDEVIFRVSNA